MFVFSLQCPSFVVRLPCVSGGCAPKTAGDSPNKLRFLRLPRAMNPAGGVIATVDDVLRYGEFHLGNGAASRGAQILSSASMQQMHATQVIKKGTEEEMALGRQVSNISDFREIWHDGFAVGRTALLFLVPSENLAVVLLTNSLVGERFNREVRRAVAEEYLGVTISDPPSITVPRVELMQYAGRYVRPFMDVVITTDGDRVLIQKIQKHRG